MSLILTRFCKLLTSSKIFYSPQNFWLCIKVSRFPPSVVVVHVCAHTKFSFWCSRRAPTICGLFLAGLFSIKFACKLIKKTRVLRTIFLSKIIFPTILRSFKNIFYPLGINFVLVKTFSKSLSTFHRVLSLFERIRPTDYLYNNTSHGKDTIKIK